eukprot:6807732-Pyramimonas_sp.AAC.1
MDGVDRGGEQGGQGVLDRRERVAEAIRSTGVRHFVFRGDQEPAIVDVKNKVIEGLGEAYDVVRGEP